MVALRIVHFSITFPGSVRLEGVGKFTIGGSYEL